MDHDRQVGVTARDIAPDFVLAIWGVQHHWPGSRVPARSCGQQDPAAIVAGCDLGIVADWREVAAALLAHLGGR
jgi:electron transfer flavoprotein alpha subunit